MQLGQKIVMILEIQICLVHVQLIGSLCSNTFIDCDTKKKQLTTSYILLMYDNTTNFCIVGITVIPAKCNK